MFFISISFQAYSDYGAVVSGVTPDGSVVLVSFGVSDTSVVVSGVTGISGIVSAVTCVVGMSYVTSGVVVIAGADSVTTFSTDLGNLITMPGEITDGLSP